MFGLFSFVRVVAISALVLVCCSAHTPHPIGPPMLLPAFVEDIFHVALKQPEDINAARGYSGRPEPPKDREIQSNLWAPTRKFDQTTVSCSDFSLRSWNDWWDQGMRDGSIIAFGYWDTPIHFVWRRGRNSIEGVIAVDRRISVDQVVRNGKLSEQTKAKIARLRGGYHNYIMEWLSNKTITVAIRRECGGFDLYRLKIE